MKANKIYLTPQLTPSHITKASFAELVSSVRYFKVGHLSDFMGLVNILIVTRVRLRIGEITMGIIFPPGEDLNG